MQSFRENRQCLDNSPRKESVHDQEISLAIFSRIGSMINNQEEAEICMVKLDYRETKISVRALVVSSIDRITLTLDS